MKESKIRIQVNSFCPFIEGCPDLSYSECSDCLNYIISRGRAKMISAKDSRMPSRI